jgi:hypothetical protein
MGPFFQEWSDADPHPQRINSRTWHRRLTRTACPTCHEEYLPAVHRQRYCDSCKGWYHVECLGEQSPADFDTPAIVTGFDVEHLDADGFPSVWGQVLACPTVRGHHNRYDFDNTWLTTGSGTHKSLIGTWKANDNFPEDWQDIFGENFLTDILRKSFKRYECPSCGDQL